MRIELLLMPLLVVACGRVPSRLDGWEVGSGGGKCKSAWIDATNEAAAIVAEGNLAGLSGDVFRRAVDTTEVVHRTRVFLDREHEREVDAANFAKATPPRIEVGCERFLSRAPGDQVELAVHEYAGILGLDDSRKEISGRLDVARVCRRTPQVRVALEAATGKRCNEMRSRDLSLVTELRLRLKGIETLSVGDFAGLTGLRRLDLGYNSLERLPAGLFRDLKQLSTLDLRGNELHALPRDLFDGVELGALGGESGPWVSDFWENPLERLERGFLGRASKAREVSICPTADRSLTQIDEGAFEGIAEGAYVSLCLDLSRPLPAGALRGLERASGVAWAGQGLDRLPTAFFRATKNAAQEFAGPSPPPEAILSAIDANEITTVVRFYHPRPEAIAVGALTRFHCTRSAPNGREPAFLRRYLGGARERMVCYRR